MVIYGNQTLAKNSARQRTLFCLPKDHLLNLSDQLLLLCYRMLNFTFHRKKELFGAVSTINAFILETVKNLVIGSALLIVSVIVPRLLFGSGLLLSAAIVRPLDMALWMTQDLWFPSGI